MEVPFFRVGARPNEGAEICRKNGVDVIVFTAGVGENSATTRAGIASYLTYLGTTIDEAENAKRGEHVISTPDSKVTMMVIPTDEELVIAQDTKAIVSAL